MNRLPYVAGTVAAVVYCYGLYRTSMEAAVVAGWNACIDAHNESPPEEVTSGYINAEFVKGQRQNWAAQ